VVVVTVRGAKMKRAAQLLVVILIIGGLVSNCLAQDEENLFDGLWRTERGSIVKMDGNQGVFVFTPVKSWKGYINRVVIKNIRQKDDKWIAEEFIVPDGKGLWTEVEWELQGNRIIRHVLFQGKSVASYYERTELHRPHNVDFGFMSYHFDYEEDVPSPLKSKEEGWLPGFYLGYTYKKKDDPYTRLFMEYTNADTDYDGTTQPPEAMPIVDTTDNVFFRLEWDVGYAFDSGEKSSLTPYIGYGYRYWKRGLGGPSPFDEEYTWHYFPVGIRADFELSGKWNIGANVAMRFMFGGKMRAFLSQIDSSASDFKVDLGDTTGWFAEIPVRYRFSDAWSCVGTPWYEYSEIGKSNQVYVISPGNSLRLWHEPASTTHQYGINVGLAYSF
jgi:hypothetical protein